MSAPLWVVSSESRHEVRPQRGTRVTPEQATPIINALRPILTRVRRDATALKKPNGESAWTQQPLTKEVLAKHLNGGPARGVCPIKAGESVTMLGLLDLDSHGGETPWEEMCRVALEVTECLALLGLHAIPFRSGGGRGLHLYVLWDEPQDAYSVREALKTALAAANLKPGTKGVACGEVEVFPKQDSVPADGYGNQFFLPMAGKSRPVDLMFAADVDLADVQWPSSAPVPKLQRPAPRVQAAESSTSLASLRTALAAIPNDGPQAPDYDEWRNIIFSIHDATGGSDEGLELAIEFSAKNTNMRDGKLVHNEKFLRERVWPYARSERSGNRITAAHLKARAREHGWSEAHELSFEDAETGEAARLEAGETYEAQPEVLAEDLFTETEEQRKLARYDAVQALKTRITETSDEYQLREVVAPAVRENTALGEIERETLAQVLCDQLRGLGTKATIAQCRKLVTPSQRKKAPSDNLPEWARGWVYVTDKDKFYRIDSEEWLTQLGFRAKHNRVAYGDDDGKVDAARDALDNLMIPVVTRGLYLPWANTDVFEHDGVQCVNTYRPSSVPAAVDKLDAKGQAAVDLLVKHIDLLCGGRAEVRDVILDWMAFNVQNPGVKIRWAPLIKGIPGDGKSLIGTALEAIMGSSNVNTIGPDALASQFTGWAQGACVALLEEVRIVGHNKYDVFNTLKPYITNSRVPCHPKGQDPFTIINVTNYVGFTNYNDALPIDNTDRRWMVIFSPFTDIAELAAQVGGDHVRYFERLFRAINEQRASLRRYMLDRDLRDFRADGRAPITEERESMIGLALSDDESGIRELLADGAPGIAKRVLASSYVNQALQAAGHETTMQTTSLTKALTKAGWTKYPKRVRWNGKPEWLWVKGPMPKDYAKLVLELDATLGTAVEGLFEELSDCEDLFN